MKFIKSKDGELHPNYVSRVIQVTEDNFLPHPHPEVTGLKRCIIGDDTLYNVLVNINSKPGKYIFFPASTKINPDFLSYANLYRHTELNKNPEAKPGLFEDNGRVKSVKLKGILETKNEETGIVEKILLPGAISDGFLIELSILLNFMLDNFNIEVNENDIETGVWFDTVEHNGKTFWLSKKFIPQIFTSKYKTTGNQSNYKRRQRKVEKRVNKVIPEQWRFHYDTTIIRKCPFVVQPNDYIHISGKLHGTSLCVGYVLCKQELNWKQKIARFLTGYEFNEYDYLYSSRTVIKNKYIMDEIEKDGNNVYKPGYYNSDIWGEAFKIIKPELIKGMMVYAEIVGYLPTNSYVLKGYDYGCVQMKSGEEYTYEKHFKIFIYRITMTNIDGVVHEYSPKEVQIWCKEHNLNAVPEYYYGKAKDLYPELDITNHWHQNFWDKMSVDKNFNMELDSPDCLNKVPHEGVVIKIDDSISRAFKLKCFKFTNKEEKELDKGEFNIEDTENSEENE